MKVANDTVKVLSRFDDGISMFPRAALGLLKSSWPFIACIALMAGIAAMSQGKPRQLSHYQLMLDWLISTGGQSMDGIWLTVQKGGRTLVVTNGEVAQITGHGKLIFKDSGKYIELPEKAFVKIDGAIVTARRAITDGQTIEVYDATGSRIWVLRKGNYPAPSDLKNWVQINGQYLLNSDDASARTVQYAPTLGLRMASEVLGSRSSNKMDRGQPLRRGADHACSPNYRIAAGESARLRVNNGLGEMVIVMTRGQMAASLNGVTLPTGQVIREGRLLRIVSDAGETLLLIGIAPNGRIIYSPDFDPRTSCGRIGLRGAAVDEALVAQLGLNSSRSLLVNCITTGSSADKAGLKPYDVITRIDGKSPATVETLDRIIAGKKSGEKVVFTVIRDGNSLEIVVPVETGPNWMDSRHVESLYRDAFVRIDFLKAGR